MTSLRELFLGNYNEFPIDCNGNKNKDAHLCLMHINKEILLKSDNDFYFEWVVYLLDAPIFFTQEMMFTLLKNYPKIEKNLSRKILDYIFTTFERNSNDENILFYTNKENLVLYEEIFKILIPNLVNYFTLEENL